MTPDLKTLRSVATKAARRNWTDDDMQAFDDAFRPQAVLSLLDRVEALEERDDLAMQIISENAKLRREAEAMAETVRTLEAERDRLRGENKALRDGPYGARDVCLNTLALVPALNPTVCLALIARARDAERLEDKVDGLTADLREAVEVAFLRGATEWVRLNYPADFKRLSALNEGGPANG